MKLLVVDFWFGNTHQRTNKRTLQILSRVADLLVANYDGYYDELTVQGNMELVEVRCHNQSTSKLKQRFRSVYNIYETWKVIKKRTDYDAILVTGYEVISIAFMRIIFRTKKPIFLQYHQHVDEVVVPIKRLFFNFYKNKYHHVFLEESFAEYFLKSTRTSPNKVHVVHHFIMDKIVDDSPPSNLVLGISSSNDERIIENIIEAEKNKKFLENNGLKAMLRSSVYSFKNEYLNVENRYMDAQEYKQLFDMSDCVLVIPRKDYFQHRVSGLLYDALSSRKKVLGVDIEIMRIMNKIAPSMYYIIKDQDDLTDKILECANSEIDEKDLMRIREKYSDRRIENEYRSMFKKVVKNI